MKTHSIKFNFIMNTILTVSSLLFPLITFPYISRTLLVEGSGKVAFATSIITYFTMFASLGIPTYGIRACARVRDNKEELSKTVQELLIISGVTTAITYLVFIAALFLVPQFAEKKTLLLVMGTSIALTTIGVQWFYTALEQYSYITTCALIFKVIGIALMLMLVKEPEDYVLYGGIYVIGTFGSYLLNFIRLRKFITFRKTGMYDLARHIKPTLIFFAMSAGTSIYLNLDVVMLEFMKGDVEVGYYNAGIKVKTVLVTAVTSLGTVLLPRLSYYIEKGDKEKFKDIVIKAFEFVLVLASSVTVFFTICAEESILFLAGKAFLPSVIPMWILMPTVLLIGLSNITGMQILTPLGEEKKVLYSILAGAVLDFGLNCVLIPTYGAAGASLATTLAEVLVLIVQIVFLKNMLKDLIGRLQLWKIAAALLVAGAAGAFVHAKLNLPVFWMLVVCAAVFFGLYGMILLVLREKIVIFIFDSLLGLFKRKNKG